MKKQVLIIVAMCSFLVGKAQDENFIPTNYWQIGIGLGELPTGGSFKPSITIGYHQNEKLYWGVIYQFKDKISRDGSSFNAKSTELDGLLSSSETVAHRFIMEVRFSPVKYAPYLAAGFVYNGKDVETMKFDALERIIAGETYTGDIQIEQTRPGGGGLALGIGYQYNFKNGISANAEWTPAWLQYPTPEYEFSGGANLSERAKDELKHRMDDGFNSSVTNMYKVFHIGVAYNFK